MVTTYRVAKKTELQASKLGKTLKWIGRGDQEKE
jgi:hypothetical protein